MTESNQNFVNSKVAVALDDSDKTGHAQCLLSTFIRLWIAMAGALAFYAVKALRHPGNVRVTDSYLISEEG